MNEIPRGLGDNHPPATLADELAIEFRDDLAEAAELLEAAGKAPARFDDDETQNKAAEIVKKLRALEIKLDKACDTKKKPFADKVTEIRGFFTTHIERMEKARLPLKTRGTDYLDRKAAAERQRLKEEEDARRLAAEQAMKLAKDAEDTKNAASAQLAEAKRLWEEAEEAKSAATTEQEVAAAVLAAARAGLANTKASMLQQAAEFANRAKDGDPPSQGEKDAMREAWQTQINQDRAKVDAAEQVLKDARAAAVAAREKLRQQEDAIRAAAATVRVADREVDKSLGDAVRETKAADKIAAKVEGPDADLARTRSLHGAVSTLARQWTWRVDDRDKLDKAALWPFIHGDAIAVALGKWMHAQPLDKRVMAGATMSEDTQSQIR